MPNKISQREARRLQKQVRDLIAINNRRHNVYVSDWPGGVHLGDIEAAPWLYYSASTARRLGSYVVITTGVDGQKLRLYAVKP